MLLRFQLPTSSLGCVVCLNVEVGCLNVDNRCLNINELRVFYDEVPGVSNQHAVREERERKGPDATCTS